ncbi:MAG: 2-oxo-hepta-3-ene-1,7-dioic acid hydratase [Candidatus Binataceae bacterium]|nr:2-oxo-hepta-3-ene-1,7-dioic acid hydratase [Candidatus Binataceae bacterium]
MLDNDAVKRLAAELNSAQKQRKQISQLSKRFPEMTVADGYRINRAWVAIKHQESRVTQGHKIGLTSRAMQQMAQLTEPDYGTLFDDMFFREGGEVPFDRFIAPMVEVELAFVLGKPLRGPQVTIFDVLAATDFVVPAVEIIDTRIERFDPETKTMRKVQDTIADNAASAGVVLGSSPIRPEKVDLRWACALLSKNSVIEETGVAAGVLNHPANGVVWLTHKLSQWDEYLAAGEIVLGGSFTRPVSAAPGDTFHADYGTLGSISFRFV